MLANVVDQTRDQEVGISNSFGFQRLVDTEQVFLVKT
jgi:hypothetical protein